MEQIRKTVVGVYHVFGHQAKIAVIKSANAKEEIFVCDFLNGVETVLTADRNVPFAQAPFELTLNEKIDLGLMSIGVDMSEGPEKKDEVPKAGPKSAEKKPVEKKPEAKPAPKKSAPKGKAGK